MLGENSLFYSDILRLSESCIELLHTGLEEPNALIPLTKDNEKPQSTTQRSILENLRMKYGYHLFPKETFHCFFKGCNREIKTNVSRHILVHERNNDPVDQEKCTLLSEQDNYRLCYFKQHDIVSGKQQLTDSDFYRFTSVCKKCCTFRSMSTQIQKKTRRPRHFTITDYSHDR